MEVGTGHTQQKKITEKGKKGCWERTNVRLAYSEIFGRKEIKCRD